MIAQATIVAAPAHPPAQIALQVQAAYGATELLDAVLQSVIARCGGGAGIIMIHEGVSVREVIRGGDVDACAPALDRLESGTRRAPGTGEWRDDGNSDNSDNSDDSLTWTNSNNDNSDNSDRSDNSVNGSFNDNSTARPVSRTATTATAPCRARPARTATGPPRPAMCSATTPSSRARRCRAMSRAAR